MSESFKNRSKYDSKMRKIFLLYRYLENGICYKNPTLLNKY